MDSLSLAYEINFIKPKLGELQKYLNLRQFVAKPTLDKKKVGTFND